MDKNDAKYILLDETSTVDDKMMISLHEYLASDPFIIDYSNHYLYIDYLLSSVISYRSCVFLYPNKERVEFINSLILKFKGKNT